MDEERYVRDESTMWRHTLTGILLLPPALADPVLVTTPGEAVWAALAAPSTLAELVERLAVQFGADTTQVRADVAALLEELCRLGAVRLGTADSC